MIEKAVLQVCKNQLQEALPKCLLSKIEDRDTRGQIDDDLVDEYTNNFNAPIDMTQGFNTYVEQQEECKDFFSDAQ
eukprot:4213661-Ditylum_brightwellii.AAC.2